MFAAEASGLIGDEADAFTCERRERLAGPDFGAGGERRLGGGCVLRHGDGGEARGGEATEGGAAGQDHIAHAVGDLRCKRRMHQSCGVFAARR